MRLKTGAPVAIAGILNRGRAFLAAHVTGGVDFSDDDILRCFLSETLPTFSIYLPWVTDVVVDTTTDLIDPNRQGIYQLKTPEPLIRINRVREDIGSMGSLLYDPLMFVNPVDQQLVMDAASLNEVKLTWKFEPPNIVEVFPKNLYLKRFTFEVGLVHPAHLQTVHPGAKEILRDLFLADLALDVISTRRVFQTLQTPFGELNLNLDALQEMAGRRSEIIERLTSKQHKTSSSVRIIIA